MMDDGTSGRDLAKIPPALGRGGPLDGGPSGSSSAATASELRLMQLSVDQSLPPLPEPVVDLDLSSIQASTATKEWVKRHMERHVDAIENSRSYVQDEVRKHQRDVKRNKYLIGYGKRTQNARAHAQVRIDEDNEQFLHRLCNLPGTELTTLLNKNSRANELSDMRKRNRVLAKIAVRKVELDNINFENSLILGRLEKARPAYSQKKWAADFREHERRKRLMMRPNELAPGMAMRASHSAHDLGRQGKSGRAGGAGQQGGGGSGGGGGGGGTRNERALRLRRKRAENAQMAQADPPDFMRLSMSEMMAANNEQYQHQQRGGSGGDGGGGGGGGGAGGGISLPQLSPQQQRGGPSFQQHHQSSTGSLGAEMSSSLSVGGGGGGGDPNASSSYRPRAMSPEQRDRGQITEELARIGNELMVVSVFVLGDGPEKRLLFEARSEKTGVIRCTEFSFANLVSLAEVYPKLLEKGRRVRELIGMLQLKPAPHEPEGIGLVLDLGVLLHDLKRQYGTTVIGGGGGGGGGGGRSGGGQSRGGLASGGGGGITTTLPDPPAHLAHLAQTSTAYRGVP
eukprot:g1937.t1